MQYNLQSSLLTDLKIKQKNRTFKKPGSWPNIRKNAEDGHIYILADTRYPLGFTIKVTGGYSVDIDNQHYANYNSQAQFSMADWAEYTNTEGYAIDYPADAIKAHIIDIYPQTRGNNITAFSCARVAASGTEQQGVLWAHLNLTNEIGLGGFSHNYTQTQGAFGRYNYYENRLMKALTAKNNLVKVSSCSSIFYRTSDLEYSPIIDCNNNSFALYGAIWYSGLPNLTIKNAKPDSLQYFASYSKIEKIKFVNCDFSAVTSISGAFDYATEIQELPNFNFSTPCNSGGDPFVNYCNKLKKDFVLDISNCNNFTRIVATNTTRFKGLRVSNEAPFTGAAPQINVSNTGMDRAALVQLFNDLPTVSAGQIINIVGTTGAGDLTADDEAIATGKGWTITK